LDSHGKVVSWTAGAERIKGYKAKEIIGRDFSCFFPPEEIQQGRAEKVLRLTAASGRHEDEGMRMRKDGSRFWARVTLTALRDPAGNLRGFSEVSRDLSESKKSEARYRGLLEAAPDAMVVVNKGGEIVLLNVQAEKQFGYPRDELLGKNVKNIIPEGFAERLIADALRSTEDALAQQIGTGIELTGRRKNGSDFPIEIMLSPLESVEGILVTAAIRDISVRKEAERHLAQMEGRYRGLLEAAPDAIVVVNKDGEIVLLNLQAEEQFGYPRDELIGKNVKNIIPDGFAERLVADALRSAEDALAQQIETGIELTGRRKNGSDFPIEIMLSPLENADGTLVTAAIRDISVRKRAEETLRKSEERFRLIAETIDEVFWIADPHFTKVSYISPSYGRVWGRTQASVYENPQSFLEPVHPKELDRTLLRFEIMRSGKAFDHEYRIARPDGVARWVWNRGFPVHNKEGEVIRYVGVAQDITERKQAEAERMRLLTAIEQAVEGVVVTDMEGGIQYVNPAFSAMTGYSREEALGKNIRILKSGKQDVDFYASMWATLLADQVWRGEIINCRKDGSLYTEKISITPVHNEQGKTTHFVAMKEDITARKLLEDQFRQAQKMEAVGRLAAGVAHDFNNLLTIIIGYSDLMLDQFVPSDPRRAYATEIKGAGERAEGLTRQLLAFSRQQVLAPQILDVNTLIANLTKMLKRLIREDIELVFEVGPLPTMVKADPGQIEQVLMNLAVNSRDAMPQGGKLTIETSSVLVDEANSSSHLSIPIGSYVMLAVTDTGCGMDKDVQAHIFEPFFTTKEQGKGTGLGLATVYGIIEQSGGHIGVYSEPGVGTTFKIYLPAVKGAPETTEESTVPAGGSETVLLVEDDACLRELARTVLSARGGYKVLESSGGKEALLFAGEHRGTIHLLLTDVIMPGMSGRELSEGLATLRPEMKILYMSGYKDDTAARHGVPEGGMAFLQKPFTPESLLRKVRDVLDTRLKA
jgi:PAS domain S-box-containing protein